MFLDDELFGGLFDLNGDGVTDTFEGFLAFSLLEEDSEEEDEELFEDEYEYDEFDDEDFD